jgi:hypothetical protein
MARGEDCDRHPYGGSSHHDNSKHHLAEQGRTPPLAGHRYCLGGPLLCAVTCLGLPLRYDVDLYLLIGLGPPLFWMWWPRR